MAPLLLPLRPVVPLDVQNVAFQLVTEIALGSHGLFGKQNIYEDGMRVPFFIAGPGIERGKSDALVYLHDILPTIADFAGTPVTQPLDGRSLRPVIEGKSKGVRKVLSLAYKNTQRSIRDSRWKLMVFPQINKHQLFDLQNDPHEITDLATDPEHKPQVERLTALLSTSKNATATSSHSNQRNRSPQNSPSPRRPR